LLISDTAFRDLPELCRHDHSGVRTFLYPEGLIGISMLPLS
jgi:hypothetical protein